MSSEFSCSYHPNRNAVDKCENCSIYICLECKKILRANRTRIQRPDIFSPKTVLCPNCYYEAEEKRQATSNRIGIVFPLIFVAIFIGFFLFILAFLFMFIGDSQSFSIIFWVFVPMFILIPIIFVGIYLVTFRFTKPRRSRAIQKEREVFQQSLGDLRSPIRDSYQNTELFCSTCGAIIEFNERYCPKCGSSTHRS